MNYIHRSLIGAISNSAKVIKIEHENGNVSTKNFTVKSIFYVGLRAAERGRGNWGILP